MQKGNFDGERHTSGGSSIGRCVRISLSLFSRRQIQKGWRKNEVNMKEHNENYFTQRMHHLIAEEGGLHLCIVAHFISFSYFFSISEKSKIYGKVI